MTKRKLAIAIIIADVAEFGIAGRAAIRAYVEGRISRETFNKACVIGLEAYNRKPKAEIEADAQAERDTGQFDAPRGTFWCKPNA